MFERFTDPARASIVAAEHEAERLRHRYIGTEHLLLGILRQGTGIGAQVLEDLGIGLDDVRSDVTRIIGEGRPLDLGDDDAEALRAIGIDVDEVRRRIEEAFGPGALDRDHGGVRRRRRRARCAPIHAPWAARTPFTPRAKKALELALREARALQHDYIGTEHLVLGLVRDPDGIAAIVLAERRATPQRLRTALMEELSRRGRLPGRPA
jgi:ATP-dependent Clp protease ATP-binding subunit ClpA